MLDSVGSGSAFQIVNYLFEKSPECLFVIDSNTLKLMDANQKALDAVGYSKAELLTLGINEIDTPYPGEREATYEEQESNFSTIYKRKDKSTFEVDVNVRGFMHNGCSYLLVTATEIQPSDTSGSFMSSSPKENKATSALAESELRYRTLTETAQEGIWQLDENNNTSFVNEYFAALLGYTKEEMTGKPVFDFIAEEAKTEALQLVEKRRQGIAEQHEFTLKRKDGSPVYTLMQARPLFLEGVYVGALATVLDISERKKQEKEVIEKEKYFRALFENSLDGIALLSGEGVILDISPSIERILGLTRDELLQTSRLDFIVPENTHLVIDTVQKVINDPFTPRTVEYEAIKGGGKRVWLECTYTNLLNESNVNAIVLNFRDITERKHAEKILSESERRYRKAQERAKLAHWEWNIVTNQSYWSEELFRIFRLDPKGIAPDDEKFFAFVHPDDRDQLRRQLHMAIAGNKSYEYVYRIVLENGDVKYLQEIGEVV
ncbi:MAG TPA: PAS domain S-box protein, partial [Flavisolibacter sp.]